jgi:hypothetical protein
MLKLLGIALILVSISFTGWWIARLRPAKNPMVVLCLIAVLAGLVLIMNERATELAIPNVENIKAVAQQAVIDAQEISALKERIAAQAATVDLIARDAEEARRIVEEAACKYLEAEKRLKLLDQTIREARCALSELESWTGFKADGPCCAEP